MGTEIIIFPKSMSPHTTGSLKIWKDEQYMEVAAQEHVFTYVYIPLGYPHEITNVNGIRTVATREVTTVED